MEQYHQSYCLQKLELIVFNLKRRTKMAENRLFDFPELGDIYSDEDANL